MGWLKNIGKAIEKGVQDAGKAVEKAAHDTGKTLEKAAHDTGNAVEKAAHDTGHTLEKAAQDTGNAIEKGAHDTGHTLEKAAHDTGHTLEKAAHDTGHTLEKAAHDTGKAFEKAGQDVAWNIDKGVADTLDAGKAIGRYLERTVAGVGETISEADKRIRDGKIVDAFWHAAIAPFQKGEENLALAVKESELLATVGGVAATAYGGPGGAAAYAAWRTYKETGNVEMAIRTGLLAGASSVAMGAVGGVPAEGAQQVAAKAAMTGAVGGLAVAAAGGDEDAILEGFLRSGGMVVIQAGYKAGTKGHDLDAKASTLEPYCMATVGAECSPDLSVFERGPDGKILLNGDGKPVVNMGRVPPGTAVVGMAATVEDGAPLFGLTETSKSMVAVSKVPGMNAMGFFHDQWVISWEMPQGANQATIVPAVVLTYNGTDAVYLEHLRQTAKERLGRDDAPRPAAPPPETVVAPDPAARAAPPT